MPTIKEIIRVTTRKACKWHKQLYNQVRSEKKSDFLRCHYRQWFDLFSVDSPNFGECLITLAAIQVLDCFLADFSFSAPLWEGKTSKSNSGAAQRDIINIFGYFWQFIQEGWWYPPPKELFIFPGPMKSYTGYKGEPYQFGSKGDPSVQTTKQIEFLLLL